MDTLFSLRPFDFFSNRNTYTGSAGRLRYLVSPGEETLDVQVWNQDVYWNPPPFPFRRKAWRKPASGWLSNIAALGHSRFSLLPSPFSRIISVRFI